MPGNVAALTDERALLLAFLAQQRTAVRNAAFGLTEEQARATPTPSALSVGGLVKHVAAMETSWTDLIRQRPHEGNVEDYADGFRLLPHETLDGTLAAYDAVARDTEALLSGRSLDDPVPVPKGVPWFPQDIDAWSVRWVLLHLIEETARHAGHADIVREAVDGATAMPLMAAAEGWPATEWVTPWRRDA
jgi:uncharacterized damage-inducible protein DinB